MWDWSVTPELRRVQDLREQSVRVTLQAHRPSHPTDMAMLQGRLVRVISASVDQLLLEEVPEKKEGE